jgi:hypothetical protein
VGIGLQVVTQFVLRTDDDDNNITLHPKTFLENVKYKPNFNTTKHIFINNLA